MKSTLPPSWLEHMLRLFLSPRDRETISGDLLETYREEKLPANGRRRANVWYARQVLSLAPRAVLLNAPIRPALGLLCSFTALCGLWLGFMDVYLRHPNIAWHEAIAGTIVGQALLTMAGLRFRRSRGLRVAISAGCVAILWLSFVAVHGVLTSSDFEGYILLIGLLLMVQVCLTLLMFLQSAGPWQAPEISK